MQFLVVAVLFPARTISHCQLFRTKPDIYIMTAEHFLSSHLQLSSIRMKSLMPRFSRKTPEEDGVLKRKEMSAFSSPWKVGK